MILNDTTDPQRVKSTAATAAYAPTMAALREAEGAAGFASEYDDTIARLYDKLMGRESFRYEPSADPLYSAAREHYTVLGRSAMRDAQGQAAALTGGYGSSYSQSAGQQQYDAALQRLTDSLPELYAAAFQRYEAEGEELRGRLQSAQSLRGAAYQQYRDELGDRRQDDSWALQEAEALAKYGDFSLYAELYGEEAAHRMLLAWAQAKPDAAYANGSISAEEYRKLTGRDPRGVGGGGGGGTSGAKTTGARKSVGDAKLVSKSMSAATRVGNGGR